MSLWAAQNENLRLYTQYSVRFIWIFVSDESNLYFPFRCLSRWGWGQSGADIWTSLCRPREPAHTRSGEARRPDDKIWVNLSVSSCTIPRKVFTVLPDCNPRSPGLSGMCRRWSHQLSQPTKSRSEPNEIIDTHVTQQPEHGRPESCPGHVSVPGAGILPQRNWLHPGTQTVHVCHLNVSEEEASRFCGVPLK